MSHETRIGMRELVLSGLLAGGVLLGGSWGVMGAAWAQEAKAMSSGAGSEKITQKVSDGTDEGQVGGGVVSGGNSGGNSGGVGLTIYSMADPASFDPQQFIAQQRLGYGANFAGQVPGFGVVRDERELDLKKGMNRVSLVDVAQFIDPTTVSMEDLSAGGNSGVKVVQQSFAFDLVSPQKLLERYVDREISVNLNLGDGKKEVVKGVLLSANQGQLTLKTKDGVRLLPGGADVELGELPGGLMTRPTLVWDLWSPGEGKRRVRTAYQTDGLTWRADYNLVLHGEDEFRGDLGAWVTVMNLSGAEYPKAKLKLIAGDVQRFRHEEGNEYRLSMAKRAMSADMAAEAPAGFSEKSFFEYHLYTLGRPVTILQNATQQMALFDTRRDVNVEKVLVYYGLPEAGRWAWYGSPRLDRDLGGQVNKKVDVYLRMVNDEASGLGMPLPKGKVRVFKADDGAAASGGASGGISGGDGALEFVGEDVIDHTSKNEKVLVKLGQSFDVTGERVQTDFKVDSRANWMEESFRITLANAKDKAQKVQVRESLYRWHNWEVVRKSDGFEKIDARTMHFEVMVPAGGKKVVEYTVRYTW